MECDAGFEHTEIEFWFWLGSINSIWCAGQGMNLAASSQPLKIAHRRSLSLQTREPNMDWKWSIIGDLMTFHPSEQGKCGLTQARAARATISI